MVVVYANEWVLGLSFMLVEFEIYAILEGSSWVIRRYTRYLWLISKLSKHSN